jgi:hypothetical protein
MEQLKKGTKVLYENKIYVVYLDMGKIVWLEDKDSLFDIKQVYKPDLTILKEKGA